jgi:hypothetical protein
MDDFLKQIKLIENRLRYLKAMNRTVAFMDPHHQFKREKMEAFRRYVEETGLKWEDYRTLTPIDFQKTEQFEVKVQPLPQGSLEKAETALKESSQTPLFWERLMIEKHSLEWLRQKQRCFELYQLILQ